jgi:predicted NBD/HSP70 family sugar kinase
MHPSRKLKKRPTAAGGRSNSAVLSKNFAERMVFNCIANQFEVSAPELIRYTGMPGSTIAGILSRLVGRGLVTPNGTEVQQRGRPTIRYRVCIPRPICACAMEATQISVSVFDCDLALCGLEEHAFESLKSMPDAIEAVAKAVNRLKHSLPPSMDLPSEMALEVNVVRLDRERLVSSVLPWVEQSLEKRLAEKLGMRVKMVPAVVPLIAEKQKLQVRKPKSIVRFGVGDGISAHGSFDGANYQRHAALAGQLGHVIVDSSGPLCGCGRRGCLEALCGGPALHRRLLEELRCGVATTLDYEKILKGSPRASIAALWEAWNLGDSYARDFMRPILERLAWSLGIVMNLIDPELILACGYVLAGRREWVDEIRQRAQQWTVYSPTRPIPLVSGQASMEDQLRVAGTLYFFPLEE